MNNNLRRLEKDLRSYAKRCKDVKYTSGLLLTFLLTGMLSLATTSVTNRSIEQQRQSINNSISDMKQSFRRAKRENNKLLKNANLELIQLMEQGDQVVKSSWSSWQFGANYYYNSWNGMYKGRGDKAEKYPYEGLFTRSKDPFERYISTESEMYSLLSTSTDSTSASSNARRGLSSNYGIASTTPVVEPIIGFEISAGINPKTIDRAPLNIPPKTVNTVNTPTPVTFSPLSPTIIIPSDPALPLPPTFAIVLGADCNSACNSSPSTPRQNTSTGFLTSQGNLSQQNVNSILHYTWANNSGAEKSYAFKMFWEAINSTTTPYFLEDITQSEIFFNSYNFGNEFANTVENSQGIDKNHQRFFIGGSRFMEVDNVSSSTQYSFGIPNGKTLQLGGVFTLALVSQQNAALLVNRGTITDSKEKDDQWIKNTPSTFMIDGPTERYTISKSTDGYVGYKVAIAQVYENGGTGAQILRNDDTIDFRGGRSIGIYAYIPSGGSNASIENTVRGVINLSGKESYGMKFAATSGGTNAGILNSGVINLRKNPDGVDKADNSAAIALMADSSINGGVSLAQGKALNSGTINLTDVENSVGTYVNINSDITNTGTININSAIAKTTAGSQSVNIGMRSDTNSNAKSINSGTIRLDGSYAIGILSNGSKLTNTGTITTGTSISNGVGIVGINGATIENSGVIKITGTGDTSNIGVFLKNGSSGTIGVPVTGVIQSVEVSGDKSTGVLVTKGGASSATSSLIMVGDVKVSGNNVAGIVVDESTVTLNGAAIVTVDNSGNAAGKIDDKGSYGIVVKGSSGSFIGTGTDVTAKVTTDKSTGLYSEGILNVNKANITATDGAINFYANKGNIITNGGTTETGQKSLLFYTSGSNANIQINGAMTSTIKGGTTPSDRGTAFYYESTGSGYGTFNTGAIQNYFNTTFGNSGASTLGNLTLNMESGSRLFVASNVAMDLTNTNPTNLMSGITGSPTIIGTDYKTFMLYLSALTVNQSVNLDNSNDAYNQLEIANSSIENKSIMTGSQSKQVAMAQENGNDTNGNGYEASKVTLTNESSGVITLTGEESTAIYAKRGIIENTGTINVGKKSTAIYLIEDNNGPLTAQGSRVTNGIGTSGSKGTINIGENSTGIYYKAESSGANPGTAGGVSNLGEIISSSNNVIGMTFDSQNAIKTFKNDSNGLIELKGDNSVGMYATGTATYSVENSGTIKLASSISENSPNLAMYTDKSSIKLSSEGTIEGGDKTVGLYGYEVTIGNSSGSASKISVGDGGTAIYSQGGNVTINTGSTLEVGKNKAVGVYYLGNSGTILNNANTINIGDTSFGFVNVGNGNTLTSNTSNVTLGTDSIYIYSTDTSGTVNNSTNLLSTGGKNYGIYSAGTVTNSGDMNFVSGVGNVGIYLTSGSALNTGTITIGGSDLNAVDEDGNSKPLYGIGMATTGGTVTNSIGGIINITGENSIGMYVSGSGSSAKNDGDIILSANNTTGIYADEGATVINTGDIRTSGTGLSNVTGIYLGKDSTLTNTTTGVIDIDATSGVGVYLKGGTVNNLGIMTVANDGTIRVNGSTAETDTIKEFTTPPTGKIVGGVEIIAPAGATSAIITLNGTPVAPEVITTTQENFKSISSSSIGMYVNTSGEDYTNPIEGIGYLTSEADLIIGAEAAEKTNSKYILINDSNILEPYNKSMTNNPQVKTWNIYSGSLTWLSTATLKASDGTMTNIYLAKIPYTKWAGNVATPVESTDTYNFLDGLEQRYGVEGLGTRENELFQKLNGIGNNEEILLYQAIDEMMGHQYANTQQRINATGNVLDKEFNYLRKEWETSSKDSNKVKVFGSREEYNTDTAGVIDYTSNSYGVAYSSENETIKLGNSSGWYAGYVQNRFEFKDIGKSKETQNMIKAGIYNTKSFDDNGSLQWTISGEGFVGQNDITRRFLVVDEIFKAKGDYYTYGAGLKNEISKDIRMTERTSIRPYGALDIEYGRFTTIKEKDGEVRLEVKGNDYYSIKPEVGVEFKYKQPMAVKTNLVASLGVAYENELGKVGDGENKARVRFTEADYFNIRGEKEDRKGNFKADFKLGIENTRFGVTFNAGYDTKGENIRGGIGLRVIY